MDVAVTTGISVERLELLVPVVVLVYSEYWLPYHYQVITGTPWLAYSICLLGPFKFLCKKLVDNPSCQKFGQPIDYPSTGLPVELKKTLILDWASTHRNKNFHCCNEEPWAKYLVPEYYGVEYY
jgi:hypothetical protein